MEPFNFKGSTALVVGGATGLGREIANALATHGADVIISSRNEKKLKDVSDQINELDISGNCSYKPLDITNKDAIEDLSTFVSEKTNSKLNILVNSAGINIRNSIEKIDLDDCDKVMDVNLRGAFL